MTSEEKSNAIAKYTALADEHVKRVCDNSYSSEEEYRKVYNAVLEEKTRLMAALGEERQNDIS